MRGGQKSQGMTFATLMEGIELNHPQTYNLKFFMNFVYWGFAYCAWICITLIILNAQSGKVHKDFDPLELVVIILYV